MPTPRLSLPYIETQQAQKEVTHAQALNRLDATVQASVQDKDLTAPPGSPSEGDLYLVAASATGDWSGQEDALAHYIGGVWAFLTPNTGWRVFAEDESAFYVYDGSAWVAVDTLPTMPTLQSYTVATVPSAATSGRLIYVTDAAGGAVVCFSDGSDWRQVTDRAVVS